MTQFHRCPQCGFIAWCQGPVELGACPACSHPFLTQLAVSDILNALRPMPCGHPAGAIVGRTTLHCAHCERMAALEAEKAEAYERLRIAERFIAAENRIFAYEMWRDRHDSAI